MNQFQLSALLKFCKGFESTNDHSDDACDHWSDLVDMGLLQRNGDGWFSVTEAGLRVIALCVSCASEAYRSLKLGGLAK